jgi:outer membrane protein TolC
MSWDATQRKFELGLATELDARKTKQVYDESLLSVRQAKIDAYIENETFLNLFE